MFKAKIFESQIIGKCLAIIKAKGPKQNSRKSANDTYILRGKFCWMS